VKVQFIYISIVAHLLLAMVTIPYVLTGEANQERKSECPTLLSRSEPSNFSLIKHGSRS
jgi:hypothetical protein